MSWLLGKTHKGLPEATGPFVPGCMDVLLGFSENGLLMRLYYPTDADKKDSQNSSKWISWMPDDCYLLGIAKVLMCLPIFLRIALWWSGRNIPALYGAKIRTVDKLKCIILSHGLGGHRWLYSNTCCELASRGFIVVAVEHRDHSACHTYYYKSKEDAQNGIKTAIDYEGIEFGKNHFNKRKSQVFQRAQECGKALDFMINLNKGEVPNNVIEDTQLLRKIEFSLNDLTGNIDTNDITMMGHSFGGATALLTLAQRSEFKQGILLDPWMFPIKDEHLYQKLIQPLLFINTQTFHIKTNVNAMSKYLNDQEKRTMYTLLHTTHESQTDTPFLVGFWLNWFMKKLPIETSLKINNALILRFLNKYTKTPIYIEDCVQIIKQEEANFETGLTKPWA